MSCPIWFQKLIPQQLLSNWCGQLAECTVPWLKNYAIRRFCRVYGVDLHDAELENYRDYPSFNAFFTRKLKPNARPQPTDVLAISSPADGFISEIGKIAADQILQAKNHHYSLSDLLAGDTALAAKFHNGQFITVYLAPKNYHRVHMPIDGKLNAMIHVPGKLFSVNDFTAAQVPQLFARNERVITLFDTAAGPMAVILVGAMIVGSIETVWAGRITPPRKTTISRWDYAQTNPRMELLRGEEIGLFRLGSTAIVLLPENAATWHPDLSAQISLRMGQSIGMLNQ